MVPTADEERTLREEQALARWVLRQDVDNLCRRAIEGDAPAFGRGHTLKPSLLQAQSYKLVDLTKQVN